MLVGQFCTKNWLTFFLNAFVCSLIIIFRASERVILFKFFINYKSSFFCFPNYRPKNHLRFISFNLYVITKNSRNDKESVSVLNGPHSNYYITDHIDVGVSMDTDIESQSILKLNPKDYLENDTYLTVHIEWIDSIMLFNHLYHKYDDLARIHCQQMR